MDDLLAGYCIPIIVLSIDIVNDTKYGDLTDLATVNFWLQTVIDGQTVLILRGPPCETWPAARFKLLALLAKQPRPVRDADHLWGLHSLTKRQRQPADLGNGLLKTMIAFLHAASSMELRR